MSFTVNCPNCGESVYLSIDDEETTDILSVAPVSSFGFLTDNPASIAVTGAGEIPQEIAQTFYDEQNNYLFENTRFQLPENQSISLIGGKITINGQYFYKTAEDWLNNQKTLLPSMYFPSGRFNLVSVGSVGEVSLQQEDIQLTGFRQFADITLNHTYIANIGNDGDIFIYAEQLHFRNSGISSYNDNDQAKGDAGDISIHTRSDANLSNIFLNANASSDGNSGTVKIDSQGGVNVIDSKLQADSLGVGEGNSGSIDIRSQEDIRITNSKLIFNNIGDGKAGDVLINSKKDVYLTRVNISSEVQGVGNSGNIRVESQGDTYFNNSSLNLNASGSSTEQVDTGVITSDNSDEGDAGGIIFESQGDVNFTDIKLEANSYGFGEGDSGSLDVKAQGDINFTNSKLNFNNVGKGSAGAVFIHGEKDINFLNVDISSKVDGEGNSGNLTIESHGDAYFRKFHLNSDAYDGQAGKLNI